MGQTPSQAKLTTISYPTQLHPDRGLEFARVPLPVFEAVLLSKGKLLQHVSRSQFCVPQTTHLPECPKNTKDYNSQNSPWQQHTHLPACNAPGNYKGHGFSAWTLGLVPFTSCTTAVTAPLSQVWQLHVTTMRLSLLLEDEFVFG